MSSQPPLGIKKGSKDEGLWLLSFADLAMILISFFVLLLSYSKVDNEKMKKVEESAKPKKSSERSATPVENLEAVSKKLEEKVKELKLDAKIKVLYDFDGVTLELSDQLMFGTGSATPQATLAKILDPVLALVSSTNERYSLTLEGHTDDRPVASGPFKSNWELSSSRSLALLKMLAARGIKEERMSIHAYAHTRPKVPIAKLRGAALEAARAANRRVVVRIN